jgi:hypothetical protein
VQAPAANRVEIPSANDTATIPMHHGAMADRDRLDISGDAGATLLRRGHRLRLTLYLSALVIGMVTSIACTLAALTGAFGSEIISGHRNHGIMVFLLLPLALAFGIARLLYGRLLPRLERRWRAELATSHQAPRAAPEDALPMQRRPGQTV